MLKRDRLGSRLEAEGALDRRHFIRLVPKDPFGHRQRVPDPAATTADLQVLSNRAGFRGVAEGDLVVSRPVNLYLPGNLSAARPTEAVPGLLPDAIVPRGRSASVQECGGVAFDRNGGRLGLGSPHKEEDSESREDAIPLRILTEPFSPPYISTRRRHRRRQQAYDLLLGRHFAILSESEFVLSFLHLGINGYSS